VGNPADIETVLNDATLSKDATPDVGDFRTDYFFFDVTTPPYDNIKFREALAHLLDRENIVKNIVRPILGRPAYSFLAPGFPAANSEALKDVQKFDPDLAKKLYEESGVKVDKLLITYRDDNATYNAICSTYADAIKTNLGITVEVKALPGKDFMADLLAKPTKVAFGAVSYGMDYLDPSNMLGVFVGSDRGGRHVWNDARYQELMDQAGPLVKEPERTQLYQEAEKLMVESFAFVWIYHRTPVNLWKPYLKGPGFLPGKINTNPGWAWPANAGFTPYFETMYIGNEVPARNIP
jgi:peptide/nickel transport system substrate-binding protein/oligopeptide transport system substrate-binding protein